MPITPFLKGQAFDPETVSAMDRALEKICADLGIKLVPGSKNPVVEVIAEKIIHFAQHGIRTEAKLYAAVKEDLGRD